MVTLKRPFYGFFQINVCRLVPSRFYVFLESEDWVLVWNVCNISRLCGLIVNLSKTFLSDARQPEVFFFSFLDSGFAHFLGQLVSIIVKTLRNTNLGASRCFKMKKTSLPVDVRRSKTPLLKLPNIVARFYCVSPLNLIGFLSLRRSFQKCLWILANCSLCKLEALNVPIGFRR